LHKHVKSQNGLLPRGGKRMSKRQRFEKLTHLQLQQKVIHLDSELVHCHSISQTKDRSYREQMVRLQQDNDNLRREMQGIINEHNTYYQDRNKLIHEYNKILQKNMAYQTKLAQLKESNEAAESKKKTDRFADENNNLVKLTEDLRKEAQMHEENSEKLFKEKQIMEVQLEELKKEISLMRKEYKESQQKFSKENEWEAEFHELEPLLKKAIKEREEIFKDNQALQTRINELSQKITEKDENIGSLQQGIALHQKETEEYKKNVESLKKREETLIQEKKEMSVELSEVQKGLNQLKKDKSKFQNELQLKQWILDDVTAQNKGFVQQLEVLKENMEQITQKNVIYLQKITQLDSEKHSVLEVFGKHEAELSNAKTQIMELKTLKSKIFSRLKYRLKEVRRLEKENHQIIEEKAGLLKKIAILEDDNTSIRDSVLQFSIQREADEKRLDHITSELNEVFTQTKTIIRTVSSLQDQLEAKNRKINQLKKENEKLMQEIIQLNDDFEKSEARKSELENQIEVMKTELLKAQDSLIRLELFETEKLKLKDELETKIEEFNNLTHNYQREKDSYLHVLEHVQDQVNVYKEKSEFFDSEKGSWSKQIDELKSELAKTKATLVKMEELERKNERIAAELEDKKVEIYKIQKESELALQNQMIHFNSELKLYQEKIDQYEKDRVYAENQIKEMKAKFAVLESNLKEKENFIRQFITQPPMTSAIQKAVQPAVETIKNSEQPLPIENNQSLPQGQQAGDWFQRNISQQQAQYQNVQKGTNSSSTAMDFFTLRSKTTQPSSP
jgi:chromosome segregation ATPase